MRAAGAIVIGKTNVPEMTIWPFTESPTFGPTRNPWNLADRPAAAAAGPQPQSPLARPRSEWASTGRIDLHARDVVRHSSA